MRRTMKSMVTGAVLIPVLACGLLVGATGAAHAIANGEPVPDGKYGFSVKLTMTGIPTADGGRRNSACSGALVAPRWVITAGHCFRTFDNIRRGPRGRSDHGHRWANRPDGHCRP